MVKGRFPISGEPQRIMISVTVLDKRCGIWRKAGENRKLISSNVSQVSENQVVVKLNFDIPGLTGESVAKYETAYPYFMVKVKLK